MTYFTESDFHSIDALAWEAQQEAISEDRADLYEAGEPHLHVEDRVRIPEADVMLVTPAMRDDYRDMLELAEFEGMGR